MKYERIEKEWFTKTDAEWNPGGVFTVPQWWSLAQFPHSIISLQANRALTRRNLYAYIYAPPVADTLSYFESDIVLYNLNEELLRLPFNFYWKELTDGGAVLSTRVSSFLTGTTALRDSVALHIHKPVSNNGVVANSDEATGMYLHPVPIDFPVDKVTVELQQANNFSPSVGIRVVLGLRAWPQRPQTIFPTKPLAV